MTLKEQLEHMVSSLPHVIRRGAQEQADTETENKRGVSRSMNLTNNDPDDTN
jgi:hypothetical protein